MPPRLLLPPPSPTVSDYSTSPLSSSGFSMMTNSPPTPTYVQVGFHVGSPETTALHVLTRDPREIVAEAQQRRLAGSAECHGQHYFKSRSRACSR